MPWDEPTTRMLNLLAEAQQQMWDNWLALMGQRPSSPSPGSMQPWPSLTREGVARCMEDAEQVTAMVSENLLMSQHAVMRFFEVSLSAWKALAPHLDGDGDWQSVLRSHAHALGQHLLQLPQSMLHTTHDTSELWALYLEEWEKLVRPWAESFGRAPWHLGQTTGGPVSALGDLMKLHWDAYERTFGRLLESPSLGHTRELNQDLIKGFHAWVESRRASFEYQVLIIETWGTAFEQFMQKLVSMAQHGQTVQSLRELLYLWIDVVEEAFTTLFRSDVYLQKQSRVVNSVAAYRVIERELVEAVSKMSHLPSRTELDDAYRRIYELRREMKDLKKSLHALNARLSVLEGAQDTTVQPRGQD